MIKATVHGSCLNEEGMEIISKNEVGVWKSHLFLNITLFFAWGVPLSHCTAAFLPPAPVWKNQIVVYAANQKNTRLKKGKNPKDKAMFLKTPEPDTKWDLQCIMENEAVIYVSTHSFFMRFTAWTITGHTLHPSRGATLALELYIWCTRLDNLLGSPGPRVDQGKGGVRSAPHTLKQVWLKTFHQPRGIPS